MEQILTSNSVRAHFWDIAHQDDINIPSCVFQRLYNKAKPQDKQIGLAMMNHTDMPFLYSLQHNRLEEGYEILALGKVPHVNRPEGMDARETLGCCLGFSFMQTKLGGAPAEIDIQLSDEIENLPWPPIAAFYALNGMVRFYGVYVD